MNNANTPHLIKKGRTLMCKETTFFLTKKTLFHVCTIFFLISSSHIANIYSQTANTAWPMFRQNPQHTGNRNSKSDNEPKNVKEKYSPINTGIGFITDITSSPSIGKDGTLYIGSLAKNVFSIDPNVGKITGTFTTFNSVFSSPAVGRNENVYIGSWDGSMYELKFDGTKFNLLNFVQSGAEDFGHVSGVVIDGDTGNPIPNAGVTIGLRSAIADANGEFFVDNILQGDYTGIVAGGDNCERTFSITVCGFQREQRIGVLTLFSPTVAADGSLECPQLKELVFICSGRICSEEQTKIEFQRISQLPTDIPSRINLLTLNEDLFAEHGISCSPLIGFNNWVYWGAQNNRFYGWDLDLECIFFKQLEGPIVSSPAQSLDGSVYVITTNGFLYAFNPDFSEIFTQPFEANGDVESSPAIGIDGTIYFGSLDSNLYAVKPDGSLKWKFQTGGVIVSSPAIDEDGTIYIGSGDGNLYAVEDKGEGNPVKKWEFPAGSEIAGSSPSIGRDGDIYIGLGGEFPKFIAVTKEGNLKWCFSTENGITSTPAISEDGTIFVGSFDGNVYAFENDDDEAVGFSISGKVENINNGAGIADALVIITSATSGSVADVNCESLFSAKTQSGSDGSFSVNDVPAGKYLITASADGFISEDGSETITVPLQNQENSSITLNLVPEDNEFVKLDSLTIVKEVDVDTCFPLHIKFKSFVEVDPKDTPLDFFWDFGDNSVSNEKDPEHDYSTVNEKGFNVELRVQIAGTNISATANEVVKVKEPPCAKFIQSKTKIRRGETVIFEDVSIPSEGKIITGREWRFNFNKPLKNLGRNRSSQPLTNHTFYGVGDHSVSLFIQDGLGEDKVFGTVTVVNEF